MSWLVDYKGDYDLVLRVAKDCLPVYRLKIIDALKDGTPKSSTDIARITNIPRTTCKKRLEDLTLLGVADNTSSSYYKLSERILVDFFLSRL